MEIKIDDKIIQVNPEDKNIVDVASREKIGIPAPCYRNGRKGGCCNGCVIDVDGIQKYACCTAPEQGMVITIDRADLNELRRERLLEYVVARKNNSPCSCSCSSGLSDCC